MGGGGWGVWGMKEPIVGYARPILQLAEAYPIPLLSGPPERGAFGASRIGGCANGGIK